jgi:hypothetical protein
MNNLITTKGIPFTIDAFGYHNADAGPDFTEGKIEINNTKWAGNIEMHVFSSDWLLHNHQNDAAYDNVILHVVYEHDKEILQKNGEPILTIELKDRIPKQIKVHYAELINNADWIPCEKIIEQSHFNSFGLWKYKLLSERMLRKSSLFIDHLEKNQFDWDATFYWGLCKYFGSKVNIIPFDMLAQALDFSIIKKNKGNIKTIECLLFGQAGMLNGNFEDDYFISLKQEYNYQKKKYKLNPIDVVAWKFSKIRPSGFPTIRIAQLAALINKEPRLFSYILDLKEIKYLRKHFSVNLTQYWNNHYRFGEASVYKEKPISDAFIDLIIINVIAPLLFIYGKQIGNDMYSERAFDFLDNIKSEQNNIIKKWKNLGALSKSASDSQSYIELKTQYCDKQKCLNCNVGAKLINR